ncbi:uncharacterized protein [Argopecten irradians]|uniref:uncharacterized protein n=1 Tax=Argopecten irradians TaxID=31199 RepID=UPI00371F234C
MTMTLNVYVIVLVLCTVSGDPMGCTYYSTELKYECSARSWTLPLTLSDFDNVPQSLSLVDVNGNLPATNPTATFSGFGAINTSSFDPNSVPTFTIRCYQGGMLIYHAGTFTGLGYFQNVRIQNCEVIAMPDEALQDFGDVNYFGLEGGAIGDMGYDAFKGLNIGPLAVPNPLGTFLLTSKLDNKVLPNGILYALENVTNIVIDNANVETLQTDMFQVSVKLISLSLRHNLFTSLPENMLSSLLGLQTLSIEGIDLECSCDNLWFLDHCQTNNITIRGPVICNSPSTYTNKKAYLYKKEQCPTAISTVDPCENSLPGVSVGTTCLYYLDITAFALLLVSLSLVIATVIITIHTRRQNEDEDSSRSDKEGQRQRKLSGSSFNRVSSISTLEEEVSVVRQGDDISDQML